MTLSLFDSNVCVDKMATAGVLLNPPSQWHELFLLSISSFPRTSGIIRMNGFVNLKLQAMFIVKNSHKNRSRPAPTTIYTSTDANRTKRVSGSLSASGWRPLLQLVTSCFALEKSVLPVSLRSLISCWWPGEELWFRAVWTFQVFPQCKGEPSCQSVAMVSNDLASRLTTGEAPKGVVSSGVELASAADTKPVRS